MFSLTIIGLTMSFAQPAPADSQYKILSECDRSSNLRAEIAQDAALKIHFAITGAPTCYSVTTMVDGKEIKGYLLDGTPDAVREFEKSRADAERDAFKAIPMPAPPSPPPPAPKPADAAPSSSTADSASKDAPKPPKKPQGPKT